MKPAIPFSKLLLEEGDFIFYRPRDLTGWLIAIKTWTCVCHVEVYIGHGRTVASRNGLGVGQYALRTRGVAAVLRPPVYFNLRKALEYFGRVRGQRYDWLALLGFLIPGASGAEDRQICSEFAANLARAGDWAATAPWWPASKVAPASLLILPGTTLKWDDGRLF